MLSRCDDCEQETRDGPDEQDAASARQPRACSSHTDTGQRQAEQHGQPGGQQTNTRTSWGSASSSRSNLCPASCWQVSTGAPTAPARPAEGERIPGQVRRVPGGGRARQQVRLDLQAVRISQRDGAEGGVRVHRLQVSQCGGPVRRLILSCQMLLLLLLEPGQETEAGGSQADSGSRETRSPVRQ